MISARFSTPLALSALLMLADSASAQFSAQFNSSRWTPNRTTQNASSGYGYSDGSSENAIGLTNGGEVAWFQGFDTNGRGLTQDSIVEIATVNGNPGGTGAPAGNIGGVFVYDDPNGDFIDPTDLTGADITGSGTWTTCCPNTDTFEPVSVGSADVSDGFWAAAFMPQAGGEFPAAIDTNTPSGSRTWIAGSNTTFDPTNPGGGIGFFEMSALGFDSVWMTQASGGGGGSTDLIISEIVDGTLPGGQPKWVEITNVGDPITDLSAYSVGNFNNGSTTLGGGASTQLNAVALGTGESYIYAYESDTNTACDPNGLVTCFEFVYGFAPDQFAGGGFINGDDVVALFLGQATGDGSDATLIDVYGVVGVDGTGEAWESTDGYSARCDTTPLGYFDACQWFIAGANSLEDPGGDDAIELMLLRTLTDPGNVAPCESNCVEFYCTSKTNSCGTLPTIGRMGEPSATATSGFVVTLDNATAPLGPGQNPKAAVLLYSVTGPSNIPFQGGTLCVDGPLRTVFRAPTDMGTPGACDARHMIDMNAFAQSLIPGQSTPDAALLSVGTDVWTQWFGRDTVTQGSMLSDGMTYRVRP